jgi:hypothetical protein
MLMHDLGLLLRIARYFIKHERLIHGPGQARPPLVVHLNARNLNQNIHFDLPVPSRTTDER